MKVGIVNYGMGNLASVSRALQTIGHEPVIAQCPDQLAECSRIVLPGVGAFAEGIDRLSSEGWTSALGKLVRDEGRPLLGICLGMQFLATRGSEGGEREGLNLIQGEVVHLSDLGCSERIPHVGWNEVHLTGADPLFETIPDSTDFYFVHSYAVRVVDPATIVAHVCYGSEVAAVIRRGHVWGAQFHPEKSSKAGLQVLRNFCERGAC